MRRIECLIFSQSHDSNSLVDMRETCSKVQNEHLQRNKGGFSDLEVLWLQAGLNIPKTSGITLGFLGELPLQ